MRCSSCASDSRRDGEKESAFFFRGRVLARGLYVNSIFQRVRDKGRSLPQAPPPAIAGCHPRHFDIDEGNLREHCWRRRLMRRVRARAPRGSRGPVAPIVPPPLLLFPLPFFLSVYSSACSMMNCISTPYTALRTIVLRECSVIRRIIAARETADTSALSRSNDADEQYFSLLLSLFPHNGKSMTLASAFFNETNQYIIVWS